MPDSFPLPPRGPRPFSERDLDSLLAGKTTEVPAALRPVADTLNALRAAPSPRELHGEDLARSQFRAPRPAVPAVRAAARRPGRGWLAGMVAAAAVIVLGAAVTYTGNLPGPFQRLAHDTIAAPPVRSDASASAPPGTQANSARQAPDGTHPAAGGTPSAVSPVPSAPARAALCDAFWTELQHPRDGRLPWQTPQYASLSAAAGGPRQVFGYCFPVWKQQFAQQYPKLREYPPFFPRQWGDGGSSAGQGQGQGQGQSGGAPHDGAGDSGGDTNSGTTPPATPARGGDVGGQQQQGADS